MQGRTLGERERERERLYFENTITPDHFERVCTYPRSLMDESVLFPCSTPRGVRCTYSLLTFRERERERERERACSKIVTVSEVRDSIWSSVLE